MGMILRTGVCRYCGQKRYVNVHDDREYTQDELDEIASGECKCNGAEHVRRRDSDIKRCQKYIAETVSKRFPYMTDLLQFDLEAIVNEECDKITRKKDGYTFSVGPTKDRVVDIKITWSMESEPKNPTPLTAFDQGERMKKAIQAEETVPEEAE